MKILSKELGKSSGKDILIPCYLYEIVIEETYGGKNILEEAIAKIISIDSYYRDAEKLAELLGLKDSKNDIEYKALLQLVLAKIENPQTREVRTDIKQYQIYQERISGEVLSIITTDVDRFIESSGGSKEKNKVSFERDGKGYNVTLIQASKETLPPPNREQIFAAIATHNKNGDFKVCGNPNLEVQKSRETIYLHCQIYFRDNGKFSVSNGFNSAPSLQLECVLKTHRKEMVSKLRSSYHYIDEKKENSYQYIYNDLRDEVARNLCNFNNYKNSMKLYNAYEMYLKYLATKNNYTIPYSLNNEEAIKNMAKEMGFSVDRMGLSLFRNDNGDNLKSHLARLLFCKDSTLAKFAVKNASFLLLLLQLHKERNAKAHGGNQARDYKPMDIRELEELQRLLESISEIGLEKSKEKISNDGIVLVEKELSESVLHRLSEENISELAKVYKALEICENNQALDIDSFSDIVLGLYKVCESVLLQYIQIHKTRIKDIKNIVWLDEVKLYHLENAKKGQNATLGAYTIVYHSISNDEELSHIKQLLELRAHGNPTINDIQKSNIDELKRLKKEIIDFIEKVIYHT